MIVMPWYRRLKERDAREQYVANLVKQELANPTVDRYGVPFEKIEKVWNAYCTKNNITDRAVEWRRITEELGTHNTRVIIDRLGGI